MSKPLSQRPRRVLIQVEDIQPGIVTVTCPRWRENALLLLWDGIFPDVDELRPGQWLTAEVNADAERQEDLYFRDLRLTPEDEDQ